MSMSAAVIEERDDLETVAGAHLAYDLAERELWEDYTADPSLIQGRVYLAGEQLARRRCTRAIEKIRYARGPRARQ